MNYSKNNEDRSSHHTLFDYLNRSVTPLGARRLRRWLAYPLRTQAAIQKRQSAVACLTEGDRWRENLRVALRGVRDLERLFAKLVRPAATPRDMAALRSSLESLPGVEEVLSTNLDAGRPPGLDFSLSKELIELSQLLKDALVDEPPALLRGSRGANETGFIREGFHSDLDLLHEQAHKGREWIAGLEAQEREALDIPSLKLRFHPVHGYSIEVTKANLDRVPDHYERKQTLANAERFTTTELRKVEQTVLGANERAAQREREIFEELRQTVVGHAEGVQACAAAIAEIDSLTALAVVAREENWVRPEVDHSCEIQIRAGRHPIVEKLGRNGVAACDFVPNDTLLSSEEQQILLLTGPNMSGKSTYLRQVALLVLLAQIGSWVPAEAAKIGIVDRIFTRVGASDRLSRGESTFMVEMRETASILREATPESLVILDEIGRGTSTFDGMSIAWAVVEYLHNTKSLRPRTLFATHYHELTELADSLDRLSNAHFQVREYQDEIIFLRRLVSGGANRSYGIQVARLAGLPEEVVVRARQRLAGLESGDWQAQPPGGGDQLTLFQQQSLSHNERDVLSSLRELSPDELTPLDALRLVASWSERLRAESEESQ